MTFCKRTAIAVCAISVLFAAAPLRSQEPAAVGHYLVEVDAAATAVDDVGTVAASLARTYGARLEIYAAIGFHGFAATMTPERARMMSADPRVKSVREAGTPNAAPPRPVASPETPKATRQAPAVSTPAAGTDSTPLPPIQIGPYKYDSAGNIIHMGTDRYTYDAMSRITSGTAVTASNADTQQFTYDGFGNLKRITIPNKSSLYIDVNSANNRLNATPGSETGTNVSHTWAGGANGGYDAVGNQTALNGGVYTYGYDSLNMINELNGPRREFYIYDGEEQRVAAVTYTNAQNAAWRYTLRSTSGNVLRQITDTIIGGAHSWKLEKDYVYHGGALLSSIQPAAGGERREHFHLDHLGSPVLITDDNGQRVSQHKYWPFGVDAPGSDVDGERMKFAGQERDVAGSDVNALDYLHARYYSSNNARFMTPDPGSARSAKPQSWNRYAYVRNNPLVLIDPSGKYDIYCVPADKQCNADAARFEAARAKAAKENDPRIRQAVAALGTKNDHNGVVVEIRNATADEKTKQHDNGAGSTAAEITYHQQGESNEPDNVTFKATVRLNPSLSGLELEAAVAHEGRHVFDALSFCSTFQVTPLNWNLDMNLTHFETEMNAYQVTQAVYAAHPLPAGQQFKFASGDILKAGMSQHDTVLTIAKALADPQNGYADVLSHRQNGMYTEPAPKPYTNP